MLEQISVFLENKPGRLAALMEALSGANADLRAFTIADTTEFGIVRIIARDHENTLKSLKDSGFTAAGNKIIGFTIPDNPGEMNKVIAILQDGKIEIDYSYSFMGSRPDEADIAIKTKDNDKAETLLKANGIKIIG